MAWRGRGKVAWRKRGNKGVEMQGGPGGWVAWGGPGRGGARRRVRRRLPGRAVRNQGLPELGELRKERR